MLIIPDHMIGAASKYPRCQPCSVRKEGGEPRVTEANPMAVNYSEIIKVFAARSGSEWFIKRDARRIRAAVKSTNRCLVAATPTAVRR